MEWVQIHIQYKSAILDTLRSFSTSAKNLLIISTRCIIEQYGNYTVEVDGETLNVNGINSQVKYYDVTFDDKRGYFHQLEYYDHNHYFFNINETNLDLLYSRARISLTMEE